MPDACDRSIVYVVEAGSKIGPSLTALLVAASLDACAFDCERDLFAALERRVPNCLVIDLQMLPEASGLRLLGALALEYATTPTVLSFGHELAPVAVRLLSPAADLAGRPFDITLLRWVTAALQRDHWRRSRSRRRRRLRDDIDALPNRQRQIFLRLVAGASVTEIAAEMGVCQRTVERDRMLLMRDLKTDTLAGLVRIAVLTDEIEADDDDAR